METEKNGPSNSETRTTLFTPTQKEIQGAPSEKTKRRAKGKRPFSPTHDTVQEVPGNHQSYGVRQRRRTIPSTYRNFGDSGESSVKRRAKEMPENDRTECPFFMKYMILSSISSCFLLTLPKEFCSSHLPSFGNAGITLEDDQGNEFPTVYLSERKTLSGGWKAFCLAKKLDIGDLLVFQLVSDFRFKVYKVHPKYEATEQDVGTALCLLQMRASIWLNTI